MRIRLEPSMENGFVTTATVRMPISFASCATTGAAPAPALPPPLPMPSTLITPVSLYPSISSNIPLSLLQPPHPQDLQIPVEPGPHPVERARQVVPRLHAFGPRLHRLPAVQQQSDARCVDRIAHDVRQTVDELRDAEPHRHVEHFFGELDRAFHLRAAAREHDAGRHELLEAAAPKLLAHELIELLVARLGDLGERLARAPPRRPV